MGEQPFDGNRSATKADVPEQLPRRRGEGRQRDGADFTLGELAVMRKHCVGQAAREGDRTRFGARDNINSDDIQRIDGRVAECVCRRLTDVFARAAQSFENPNAGRAEAVF